MHKFTRCIVALLVLLPIPFCVAEANEGSILYISPDGAGLQTGTSWQDAGTLDRLPAYISLAGSGGEVWIRADIGSYQISSSFTIRSGGDDGRPATVRGVDGAGQPMPAELIGTRSFPYDPNGNPGNEVFRLLSGADHLAFRDLRFTNIGNGAFRIGADIQDLSIERVTASNVMRFIEDTSSGGASSASVTGLLVRNVEVNGFSRGFARLRYDTNDVLFEDISGDSQRQDGDDFAIGVHIDGTAHNIVLRRVTMSNAHDTLHEYWNGDGFATERGTYAILFEDTVGSGNTDAGYDLKSQDTTLLRARAEDNKRNYRIHYGRAIIRDCVGTAPHKRGGTGAQAQVWVGRKGRAKIESCAFDDQDPQTIVFEIEEDGVLIVEDTAVSKSPDARMSRVEDGAKLLGCCSPPTP